MDKKKSCNATSTPRWQESGLVFFFHRALDKILLVDSRGMVWNKVTHTSATCATRRDNCNFRAKFVTGSDWMTAESVSLPTRKNNKKQSPHLMIEQVSRSGWTWAKPLCWSNSRRGGVSFDVREKLVVYQMLCVSTSSYKHTNERNGMEWNAILSACSSTTATTTTPKCLSLSHWFNSFWVEPQVK